MTHEVTVLYKPEYLARPHGCVCTCGWMSANVTEEEAKESRDIHLEQNGAQNEANRQSTT